MILGTVAMFRMWLSHKEKGAGTIAPTMRDPILDERIARIEHAVEAIAVEMERVGEGQRFVTRLLSERAAPSPQPSALPPAREESAGSR